MAYKVSLFGRIEVLNLAQFRHASNHFSEKYKASPSAPLLGLLHALYLPMLKSWRLWDTASKTDFEQNFLFHLKAALRKWDPTRGPFVPFLRYFIQTAWDEQLSSQGPPKVTIEEDHRIAPESLTLDPVLWHRLEQSLSPFDLRLLALHTLEDLPFREISERLRMSQKEIRLHWQALEARARSVLASLRGADCQDMVNSLRHQQVTDESASFTQGAWIPVARFLALPGISVRYWRPLLSPSQGMGAASLGSARRRAPGGSLRRVHPQDVTGNFRTARGLFIFARLAPGCKLVPGERTRWDRPRTLPLPPAPYPGLGHRGGTDGGGTE